MAQWPPATLERATPTTLLKRRTHCNGVELFTGIRCLSACRTPMPRHASVARFILTPPGSPQPPFSVRMRLRDALHTSGSLLASAFRRVFVELDFFSGAGEAGFNPLPCSGVSLYSFYFNKSTITMSLRWWHLAIYLCISSSISVWVRAWVFGLLFPSASHCARLFSENRRPRFAG